MGLFGFGKKKEEESVLPELPVSDEDLRFPSIKDMPPSKNLPEEESILPSLPGSENNDKFRREEIKNAIKSPPNEMQKSKFAPLNSPDILKIKAEPMEKPLIKPREIISHNPLKTERNLTKKIEPIYVRLDKFQTTVEAFDEIKSKIDDIEDTLRKTREIRAKEEQELEKWEREIQIIKTRINAIDKNIFHELD